MINNAKEFIKRNPQIIFNLFWLGISVFFVFTFFFRSGQNESRWILALIASGIDIYAQYVLALSKIKHKVKLRILYGIYLMCLALPSAVGYYITEASLTENIKTAIVKENLHKDDQIMINNSLSAALVTVISNEGTTGFGNRAQSALSNLLELQKANDRLSETITVQSETNKQLKQNYYESISEVFPVIKAKLLQVIMYTALMMWVYIALILTSWNLKGQENKPDGNEYFRKNKNDIRKYFEGAFEGRAPDSQIMNSDINISEKTKLPLKKCNEIRDYLKNMKFRGEKVLNQTSGKTELLVNRNEFIDEITRL